MGITSSRKFGLTSRKLGWKLDFRGFKSIGGRTHSSIGAERYGPRNIDDLHCDGLPLRYRCEIQSGFGSGKHCFCTACMPLCGNWQRSWRCLVANCIKVPQIYQNHLFSLKYFKHITWIQQPEKCSNTQIKSQKDSRNKQLIGGMGIKNIYNKWPIKYPQTYLLLVLEQN